MSIATRPQLSHLRALESEAIHVMREVAAEFERPVLLFSGGKDSIVLLRLAEKAFRPAPFSYVFTGGGARFWLALDGARSFFTSLANAPIAVATLVALLLYITVPRCRYFGNTAPLVMVLLLFPLFTTQTVSQPWLWALPFLFTFLGGVFADVLETQYRKMFLALSGTVLLTQAILCLRLLPAIAQ